MAVDCRMREMVIRRQSGEGGERVIRAWASMGARALIFIGLKLIKT